MPTYEYRCPEGHEFELFQKMSDKPRARCPSCGKVAARRISGGAGLLFKGSGFYITDYGKDGKGPRKDSEAAKPDKATGSGPGGEPSTGKPDSTAPAPAKATHKGEGKKPK